jgi:hypothetical protein
MTTPPSSCAGLSDWSSQAQATTVATTGSHLLPLHHPGVHRHQHRTGELEQDGDAHRQAVDGLEVEPLDERRAEPNSAAATITWT